MKGLRCLWCLFLALALAGSACKKSNLEEEFFLGPGKRYDLALEGGFNTLTINQYIRLTKPSMHPDSIPTPIRNASVVVNDGRVDIVYKESAIPGTYVAAFRGDPNYNNAYKLTLKYDGKTYTAVDTLRQVVNVVDDFLPLSTRINEAQNVEGNIPKHTFGYLNPNKWYISYKDIPFWNPSQFDQSKYYSYTHFLGSPNSLYPLNNLKRAFTLGPEEYIYIYKISLSAKYSQYLYSVFMETDWNGLFSGVPVNGEGNVSGNVQGFFSVTDVDSRRYRAKEL
ncbi:MAG: hypothetical protein WKF66_03295 [Pedobacter sp.]